MRRGRTRLLQQVSQPVLQPVLQQVPQSATGAATATSPQQLVGAGVQQRAAARRARIRANKPRRGVQQLSLQQPLSTATELQQPLETTAVLPQHCASRLLTQKTRANTAAAPKAIKRFITDLLKTYFEVDAKSSVDAVPHCIANLLPRVKSSDASLAASPVKGWSKL